MRASDCRRLAGKLRRSNAPRPLDKKPTALRRMANKKMLTLIYWNSSRRLCVAC